MAKRKKQKALSNLTREQAAATLAILKVKYGKHAKALEEENEATTRLLLIDKILCALGWEIDDFNPEKSVSRVGFTDYQITADGVTHFIVEAKKGGYTFGTSNRGLRRTDYKLSFVRSAFGQAVSDVINQAEEYCRATGIPYAVITNGGEWLLVQALPFSKQAPIEELRCFYFGNLLDDVSNFSLFWDILAKENVRNNSLEQYFSDLNSLPEEYYRSPSQDLPSSSWPCAPNSDKYLQDFYDYFFDEIIDAGRRTMLEACFVSNARLDQYEGALKRILKDTAPAYIENATELSPKDYKKLTSDDSGDQKGRVILVTGSVGSGKSTLVTKVLIEARQNQQLICLTVDLIDEVSGNPKSFTQWLWAEVSEKWSQEFKEARNYKTLTEIFGRELKEKKASLNPQLLESRPEYWLEKEAEAIEALTQSPEAFLRRSWKYYSGQHRKSIIVFLDNIDRSSDEFQKQVYAFANKLARITGSTVIITMREVTYFRAQDSDFADVRDHIVFHLKAPDLVKVLSKRVKYVENLLDSGDHRLKTWRKKNDWEAFYQASLQYAKIIKQTFLEAREANQNLSILAALAWHNVRSFLRSLKKVHSLLGSEQSWPLYAIIGSLMITTNPVESKTSLSNLYLPAFKEYKCYFLKVRTLLLLLRAKPQSDAQRGIKIEHILKFSRMYGYRDRWTRKALEDMVQQRLLECIQVPAEITYTANYKLKENHTFRASPLSAMLIEQAQFNYVYLCLLGYDLPFHSSSRLEDFIDSIQDLVELAEGSHLTESIDLLKGTESGRITARYLIESLKFERPISQKASSLPEVSIVEERLDEIRIGILNSAGISIKDTKPGQAKNFEKKESKINASHNASEKQLSLLTSSKTFSQQKQIRHHQPSRRCISIPTSMIELKKTRTRLEPMIFWALLEIRAKGDKLTIATEVERVINQFLTDEHSRVEPTNIARKLRSSAMQQKEWLITIKIDSQSEKKHYGLSEKWREYWLKLFGEPVPNID